MNNNRPAYTTDVSDTEWLLIEPHIPGQKRRGRKIEYSRREILNGIFYLVRNGCGWLNRYRRLAKNYERLPESREAMVQIALIGLMLRRLAAQRQSQVWQELRRKERVSAGDGYALVA